MPLRRDTQGRVRAAWERIVVLIWHALAASLSPALRLVLPFARGHPWRGAADSAEPEEEIASPPCPTCHRMMVLRANKTDRGLFWGCTIFPRCPATRRYGGGRLQIEPDALTPALVR